MTVAELIAALQKCPQDATAVVSRYTGNCEEYVAAEGVHEERDAEFRIAFDARRGTVVVID